MESEMRLLQIQIKENRPLKDISVPGLKRHGILLTNSSEMLDEAHILKDPSHPGSARISYRPQLNVLQKMLQSKHALQFSARYVKLLFCEWHSPEHYST